MPMGVGSEKITEGLKSNDCRSGEQGGSRGQAVELSDQGEDELSVRQGEKELFIRVFGKQEVRFCAQDGQREKLLTAHRGATRLIAVLLGVPGANLKDGAQNRALDALALFAYGFRKYSTLMLEAPTLPAVRVWQGEARELPIARDGPLQLTVRQEERSELKYTLLVTSPPSSLRWFGGEDRRPGLYGGGGRSGAVPRCCHGGRGCGTASRARLGRSSASRLRGRERRHLRHQGSHGHDLPLRDSVSRKPFAQIAGPAGQPGSPMAIQVALTPYTTAL